MWFVEAALAKGLAVLITPLRHELPIDEAAGAIEMSQDELRHYVSKGEIPFRFTQYVDWVKLADVLAFDARLRAQREEGLQSLANEEPWDDNGGSSDGEHDAEVNSC
jgi:hypothetical protein